MCCKVWGFGTFLDRVRVLANAYCCSIQTRAIYAQMSYWSIQNMPSASLLDVVDFSIKFLWNPISVHELQSRYKIANWRTDNMGITS